jgi:hypothetical protein
LLRIIFGFKREEVARSWGNWGSSLNSITLIASRRMNWVRNLALMEEIGSGNKTAERKRQRNISFARPSGREEDNINRVLMK